MTQISQILRVESSNLIIRPFTRPAVAHPRVGVQGEGLQVVQRDENLLAHRRQEVVVQVHRLHRAAQVLEGRFVHGADPAVRQVDGLERAERRELVVVQRGDLVVGQLDRLEVVVAVKGLGEDLGDVVFAEVEARHDLEVAEGVVVHVLDAAVPEADDPQVEQPHALEDVLVEVSDGVFVED